MFYRTGYNRLKDLIESELSSKVEEYVFRNLYCHILDDFYEMNEDERIIYFSGINFEKIIDKKQRAIINSIVRQLISDYMIDNIENFKEYFTDKYKLDYPTFPNGLRGMVQIPLLVESPYEFKKNNLFWPRNSLERV